VNFVCLSLDFVDDEEHGSGLELVTQREHLELLCNVRWLCSAKIPGGHSAEFMAPRRSIGWAVR
jgi:hypothetical protein